MYWSKVKDSVSHMCLAGAVVASWCLAPEVAGSSPFTVMTHIFAEFSENIQRKLNRADICTNVEQLIHLGP